MLSEHKRKTSCYATVSVKSYRENLKDIKGISYLKDIEDVDHVYSYFPALIDREKYGKSRDDVYNELRRHNIYGRRYFYPLISQFPTYRGLPSAHRENLPVAEKIAGQVLCLPIYPDLNIEYLNKICNILKTE